MSTPGPIHTREYHSVTKRNRPPSTQPLGESQGHSFKRKKPSQSTTVLYHFLSTTYRDAGEIFVGVTEQICIKRVVTRVNTPVWYNRIEWDTVYPCQFPALDIILMVGYWGGLCKIQASLVAQLVKCVPAMWETWVQSLGREDPLEKEMATHSSILTWRIPWTEKPDGLPSMGSHIFGDDWMTNTSLSHVRYIQSYTYILSVLSWQFSIDLEIIPK